MGFLSDLVERIERDLTEHPLDVPGLSARAALRPPSLDLRAALQEGATRDGVALIAEVKRASPSVGSIAADADPVTQARAYATGGASAISVLTEPHHFHGSLTDLEGVRAAFSGATGLAEDSSPIIRKDFLVRPEQLAQSRAAGADAVLLIAAALPGSRLTDMIEAADGVGLGILLETHSDDDLDRALATEVAVVGVNARDLETLDVDVERALERIRRIPGDRLAVLESGVARREQVQAATSAGASAILVGEALMRAADPIAAARELIGKE
jgi:indole-3-glycerol phosphate synthase